MIMQSVFNFYPYGNNVNGHQILRFDLNSLDENRTYLIFANESKEHFKVVKWLSETYFFGRENLYTEERRKINNITFYAFSFPKKDTEICKKTADILFKLELKKTNQFATCGRIIYVIPYSERILVFRSKHGSEEKKPITIERKSKK